MKVKTENGIDIYVLPDRAVCQLSDESPLEMSECPMKYFDYFGLTCIPELCDEYVEPGQDVHMVQRSPQSWKLEALGKQEAK